MTLSLYTYFIKIIDFLIDATHTHTYIYYIMNILSCIYIYICVCVYRHVELYSYYIINYG